MGKTMRNEGLVVVTVPIDSVKLWDKNPRKNDKAVPRLQKLLQIHGQRSPIIVGMRDKVIYKGNTTWKAMKANGAEDIAVIFKDFKSDAAAVAYGISDNKAGEWAEWDDDMLTELLQAEDFNSGFTDKKEASLASGLTEKEFSSYLLSTVGGVDTLPNMEIEGLENNMGAMLIVQFASAEQMRLFKEKTLGIMVKSQRLVTYEVLAAKLGLPVLGAVTNPAPAVSSGRRLRNTL